VAGTRDARAGAGPRRGRQVPEEGSADLSGCLADGFDLKQLANAVGGTHEPSGSESAAEVCRYGCWGVIAADDGRAVDMGDLERHRFAGEKASPLEAGRGPGLDDLARG
jgi:hypothetical protein